MEKQQQKVELILRIQTNTAEYKTQTGKKGVQREYRDTEPLHLPDLHLK